MDSYFRVPDVELVANACLQGPRVVFVLHLHFSGVKTRTLRKRNLVSTDVSKLQLQIVLVDKIIYPIAMANLMTTNKNNFFVALFYQMESHESSSLRTVAINSDCHNIPSSSSFSTILGS